MTWINRRVELPTPELLVQDVDRHGSRSPSMVCLGDGKTGEQGLFLHLRSVARRIHRKQRSAERETFETGETQSTWEEVGLNPHFLHAFLYALVAFHRKTSTSELWIPGATPSQPVATGSNEKPVATAASDPVPDQRREERKQAVREQIAPQLPMAARMHHGIPGRCGACTSWDADAGQCNTHGYYTSANNPGCEDYA